MLLGEIDDFIVNSGRFAQEIWQGLNGLLETNPMELREGELLPLGRY